MAKLIFLLDNGHGKETPGKRSPSFADGTRLFEWQWTRQVVAKIGELCAQKCIQYKVLVPELEDISLAERVRRANNFTPPKGYHKIFVSIHANAAGNGTDWHSANGFEVFTTKGVTKSDKVAEEILNQLQKQFPTSRHRHDTTDGDKDKEENFYVLKHTTCPAVLTENGFFTNLQEAQQMLTDTFQYKVAQAHVDAFEALQSIL